MTVVTIWCCNLPIEQYFSSCNFSSSVEARFLCCIFFSSLSFRFSLFVLAFSFHSLQNLEQLSKLYSSLFSTCPYHLIPFAVTNPFTVSFNLILSICPSVVFLSTTFQPHIAPIIALSILLKITFSFSFEHHVSLPYIVADFTQQRKTLPFIFRENLFPSNNSPHS